MGTCSRPATTRWGVPARAPVRLGGHGVGRDRFRGRRRRRGDTGGGAWRFCPGRPARTAAGVTSAWVAFADPQHGWVAVAGRTPGSTLYATDDGEQSWRAVGATPVDGPLHPVDTRTLFALGSRLWRSDDGGLTWRGEQPHSPATPDLPARYAALALFGIRGVLQVNVPTGMMGFTVFDVTADGGRTWTSRRAPDGAAFNNTGPPLMLSATGPDDWHISQGRRLWETTDAGGTWQEITTDLPAVNIVDLSFATAEHAWTVATQRVGDEEVRSLYATEDAGRDEAAQHLRGRAWRHALQQTTRQCAVACRGAPTPSPAIAAYVDARPDADETLNRAESAVGVALPNAELQPNERRRRSRNG